MGGTTGSAPFARTTWSAVWRTPSTSTTPGAGQSASAAKQVDAVVGKPALLAGVGVVRDHEVAPGKRRVDVDLGARPRRSRARVTASPGRSSVFDGMHAQYEHSPPTSSRSTSATRRPPSASAPAQCSPGEPPPMTMTS